MSIVKSEERCKRMKYYCRALDAVGTADVREFLLIAERIPELVRVA